jgi:hypothetical protein
MLDEIRTIPEVRRLAEVRADEMSNGEKRLEDLGALDREACWLAAEAEAITRAERYYASLEGR